MVAARYGRAAVDTAAAIPGSELQIHPDMGHLVPWELWPDLVTAVVRTVRRGEELAAGQRPRSRNGRM